MYLFPALALAAQLNLTVAHDATVTLSVDDGTVAVTDTVVVPTRGTSLTIELHAGLNPTFQGAKVVGRSTDGDVETIALERDKDGGAFTVTAQGPIVHAPQQLATEHQRSFQETIGTIEPKGVYLSPQSRFLPVVLDDDRGPPLLVTGKVSVRGLPAGFRVKVEGTSTADGVYVQDTPIEGFHVVAGPLTETARKLKGVDVKIWLRTKDGQPAPDAAALAERYLEVTGQYLALYGELIGPYPYSEFVLVENFWETGYGMPSFTLLGPQVVRFPFIVHTSWPHELLHNWWGNGVFPQGGNWTEGLTAYLADHFTDERQGRGTDYRRNAIQKYLDFVDGNPADDLALTDFRGRFSASSEAVGYGKMLMVFHMLRRRIGDDAFRAGLKHLYKTKRFQRASLDDVAQSFSVAAGHDTGPFMRAWTTTTGIPTLHLAAVQESQNADRTKRTATVTLSQTQQRAPWPMTVPVVLTTTDGRTISTEVTFAAGDGTPREAKVTVPVPGPVARVDVDPFFEVFRRLGPDEVPPSLSRALGAQKMLFVVPTMASSGEREAWPRFARSICPDAARCPIVTDKDVATLPNDAAVWVLGYTSLLRAGAYVHSKPYGVRFDDRGFFGPGGWDRVLAAKDRKAAYDKERTATDQTSLAVVVEHPRNRRHAMVLVGAVGGGTAIDALAKKLPHYGKYGAVGFAKDTNENMLKLQWTSETSPLQRALRDGPSGPVALAAKAPPPIATLPPAIDGDAMLTTVKALADPKRFPKGRIGPGRDEALSLIVERLREVGITTAVRACTTPREGDLCNLVVTLPGTQRSLPPVVLGAHFDSFATEKSKHFGGADDNASGIAVAVEVAGLLRKQAGARDVLIVFFDAEERGLLGSKAFVAQRAGAPLMAMVNLDTVGRAGGRPHLVLDAASATEWVHIARGVTFTVPVRLEVAPQGGMSSDQASFINAGVPAIQLFSGPTPDYHKPTDTADKVEPKSLTDAALAAREIVAYLRDRQDPLTPPGATSSSPSSSSPRRASLGSVPDMTFAGPGVRFDDVTPQSPAAIAGLQKGDVLVRFDGKDVTDLKGYSELLKQKAPGDTVEVVVSRGGREVRVQVVLAAR